MKSKWRWVALFFLFFVSFPALATLSQQDERLLTEAFNTLSTQWHNESTKIANKIFKSPETTQDDLRIFFEKYFIAFNKPLTPSLKNYLIYPLFRWLNEESRIKVQQALIPVLHTKFLSIIHHEDFVKILQNNDSARRATFEILRLFNIYITQGHPFFLTFLETDYQQLLYDYPNYFASMQIQEAYIPAFRVQLWANLLALEPLTQERVRYLARMMQLPAPYDELLIQHHVLLHDNFSFSQAQLNLLSGLLNNMPLDFIHPDVGTHITQIEFLKNTGEGQLPFEFKEAINLAGLGVGDISENSFPADYTPVNTDVFSIIAAHELNHLVDKNIVQKNSRFKALFDSILAHAKGFDLQYLRSFANADQFFQSTPQELFASTSNQWFTSSYDVLKLAFNRCLAGYKEPFRQALLIADVYANTDNQTPLFTIKSDGVLSKRRAFFNRDHNERITTFATQDGYYQLEYDEESLISQCEFKPSQGIKLNFYHHLLCSSNDELIQTPLENNTDCWQPSEDDKNPMWGIDFGMNFHAERILLNWVSKENMPRSIQIDLLNNQGQWESFRVIYKIHPEMVIALKRKIIRGWRITVLNSKHLPKLTRAQTYGWPTDEIVESFEQTAE